MTRPMCAHASPDIDIVIPNWNGRAMLEICLASLDRQTYRHFQVIVIDNGSSDGSVEFIKSEYPDVLLIEFQENQGFSRAVNKGIKAGSNNWVLLLNNDIEVEPCCLENLMKQAHAEPEFAWFALKMVSFHDRTVLDGAGDGVLRGGVGYRFGTMESDSPSYGNRKQVFGACGGAALYKRRLLETIGYFDVRFFAYLEDVDLNMRAVQAGYTCLYIPDAIVYHIGSATTGSKINNVTVKLTTRNNIFVICRNYSWRMFFRFLPALLVYQLFWFLFIVKKRQFIAYISGLHDALPRVLEMCRRNHPHDAEGGLHKRLTDKEFGDRIIGSERDVVYSIMSRRSGAGKNNMLLRIYLKLLC